MKNVVDTVLQSNAEMAAAQEKALVSTSGTAKSKLEDINALAENAESSFERLTYAIVSYTGILQVARLMLCRIFWFL